MKLKTFYKWILPMAITVCFAVNAFASSDPEVQKALVLEFIFTHNDNLPYINASFNFNTDVDGVILYDSENIISVTDKTTDLCGKPIGKKGRYICFKTNTQVTGGRSCLTNWSNAGLISEDDLYKPVVSYDEKTVRKDYFYLFNLGAYKELKVYVCNEKVNGNIDFVIKSDQFDEVFSLKIGETKELKFNSRSVVLQENDAGVFEGFELPPTLILDSTIIISNLGFYSIVER
jgi:hypothetical protein